MKSRCWLCEGDGMDGCKNCEGEKMEVAKGDGWELRRGDYKVALADREWDVGMFDTPYSAKTHAAHDNAVRGTRGLDDSDRRVLEYPTWTPADVQSFCAFIVPRTRGWCVSITDHHLAPVWAEAFEAHGLYAFSPLAFLHPGSRVRLAGDGPAQWSVWIVVARPRREPFSKWGALPGGYVMPKGAESEDQREIGGKPVWLLRQLVRDYSRPGDTICDPTMGWCSAGVAAIREGRKFIGSEIRQEAFAKSVERMRKPAARSLFTDAPPAVQTSLLDL